MDVAISEMEEQESSLNSCVWKFNGKYVGRCAMCGVEGLKRNMYTISVRKPCYYGAAKTLCHVCPACWPALAEGLDASLPE